MTSIKEQVFRKNEGLILICQNNEDQSLVIFGANKRAQEITGFDEDFFRGRSLTEIVPKDIRDTLEDYIEYSDDGSDLAEVLGKVRHFRLFNVRGDEVPLTIKIALAEAKDKNFWYRLILRDETYEKEVESFKQRIAQNFKGHEVLDADTGLPDRASLLKDLEIAHFHANEKEFSCCFALFRLDKFEDLRRTFGKKQALAALKQIGANLKRGLRDDDTVGRIGEDELGVVLMDITPESARVVLNRLRWLVASEPLRIPDAPPRQVTVSVTFSMIGETDAATLFALCEEALAKEGAPNAMIEK